MTTNAIGLNREFIHVHGRDALRFLQGMLTADIQRASLNGLYTCGRSFLLNHKGKIVSELLFFLHGNEEIYLSTKAGYGQKVRETLEHFIIADDVELKWSSDTFRVWNLPKGLDSSLKLEKVSSSIPAAKDIVYEVSEIEKGVFFVPRGQLSDTHGELWVRSEAKHSLHLQEINEEEILALRIERGVPEWGVDFNEESFLLEFPVQDAISFHKGCYIGQEVVARTTYRGRVVRAFVRMNCSKPVHAPMFVVLENQTDKIVGQISSSIGLRALGSLRVNSSTEALCTQDLQTKIEKVDILIETKKE